jgi:hypothetical protein
MNKSELKELIKEAIKNILAENDEPSKSDVEKEKEKAKESSRLVKYQEEKKKLEKELKDGKEKTKEIAAKKAEDRTESDKNHLEKMKTATQRIKELEKKLAVKI